MNILNILIKIIDVFFILIWFCLLIAYEFNKILLAHSLIVLSMIFTIVYFIESFVDTFKK